MTSANAILQVVLGYANSSLTSCKNRWVWFEIHFCSVTNVDTLISTLLNVQFGYASMFDY